MISLASRPETFLHRRQTPRGLDENENEGLKMILARLHQMMTIQTIIFRVLSYTRLLCDKRVEFRCCITV